MIDHQNLKVDPDSTLLVYLYNDCFIRAYWFVLAMLEFLLIGGDDCKLLVWDHRDNHLIHCVK